MRPRVLVVRSDNNGDVLLMGPAIRAVAATASWVALLCGPRGRAAAEMLPGVDERIVFRAPWIDPEPEPVDRAATDALVADVARRRFDQALIFTSFHQSALPLAMLMRFAGVPTIAAISEDYPGSLLDVRHHVPDHVHEVDRALSLVWRLGYRLPPTDDGRLRVRMPAAEVDTPPRPYVVVHPGASVPARAWSPENARVLVRALADRGTRVVVTGGPRERSLTAAVAGGEHPLIHDVGGATSFGGLAPLLAGADALVCGNTGPAHLAAAVGTPVVSLFAPTVPASRWRPWRVEHRLLGDQAIACAGCRARICPVNGHPCIDDVDVEEVLVALDEIRCSPDERSADGRHAVRPRSLPAVFEEVAG